MTRWVHDLIATAAPDRPALVEGDATLRYGELEALSRDLAKRLETHGVAPGDRVMLVAENCISYAVCVLACSRLAAWVVPVNARHTGPELAAIRDHCGARCMVFAGQRTAAHAAEFGADMVMGLPCGDLRLTRTVTATPEPVPDDPAARTAAILYTTGTTSAPKGVMLSHANLWWNAGSSARLRGLGPDDTVLGVLPGSHIFGFGSTMLAAMHGHACLRILPRFDPAAVVQALADGVSALPVVPQMFERILTHLDATGTELRAPRLRYISVGGAPLDPDLKARVEARFGLPLMNGYGLTETSAGCIATRPDAPRADVSIGTPMESVSLTIDTPDKDGVGELVIESPGVMLGYYRDPDATAAALIRPGVFRTGDLGRIGVDGGVYIEGRSKELIIRSGFNVYPPEIEGMLTRHPDVHQAAVVPYRRAGNEDILAFVMARDGLTSAALADWLRPQMIAYKQPQHIFMVPEFPIAPTGKVLKHKLCDHFADLIGAATGQGTA